MNDMDMLMDLIALGSGIYCFYTWIKLMVTKKLFKNGLLVPKDKEVSDCADEEAFIAYMKPPLAAVAMTTMAYGILFLVNDNIAEPFISYPWSLIPLVLVLPTLVWYAVRNGKANREYFGM